MRGGLKKKIEIKERETKAQRSVACSKRRKGLFKKAAEVSVTSGAIIAIYTTSPSENSEAIHSFASHSSAYEIARCFLNNEIPSKSKPNPKSSFWWENLNPELEECEDPIQLQNLMDRLRKARDDAIAAYTKKKQNQLTVPISQNPNFSNGIQEATAVELVTGHGFSGGEGWLIDGVEEKEMSENFAMPSNFEECSQIGPFGQISNATGIFSEMYGNHQIPNSATTLLNQIPNSSEEISQMDKFDQLIPNSCDEDEDEFYLEIEKYCK